MIESEITVIKRQITEIKTRPEISVIGVLLIAVIRYNP